MTEKILIELYLPVSGKVYEMRVPIHLRVGEVTELLIDFFGSNRKEEYMYEEYLPGNDAILCDEKTGRIFNVNAFVGDCGWKEGSRIFMI